MSFQEILTRILKILNGGTAPLPPLSVTNITPKTDDSKETLALKWEKYYRDHA